MSGTTDCVDRRLPWPFRALHSHLVLPQSRHLRAVKPIGVLVTMLVFGVTSVTSYKKCAFIRRRQMDEVGMALRPLVPFAIQTVATMGVYTAGLAVAQAGSWGVVLCFAYWADVEVVGCDVRAEGAQTHGGMSPTLVRYTVLLKCLEKHNLLIKKCRLHC